MILNPLRMVQQGILLNLQDSPKQIAQNGVDLHIKEIYKLASTAAIYADRPADISEKEEVKSYINIPDGKKYYNLLPNYYGLTFYEGVNLPSHVSARIVGRSSLLRSGVIVQSGVFDSGFKTNSLGCFALVTKNIVIEEKSRLAQIVFYHSDSASTYSGRWMNL